MIPWCSPASSASRSPPCSCSTVASAAAADKPRCYGAASRDPQKPCTNPNLRLKVTPTPNQALLRPNSICNRLHVEDLVRTCWWGARAKDSKTTVALIGDSHASAWRAVLSPIGKRRHWRGISNTLTSCAFSKVVSLTPKSRADECRNWNEQTVAWFGRHPEVTTRVRGRGDDPARPASRPRSRASATSGSGCRTRSGTSSSIRDNPRMQADTPPCIYEAMARQGPGRAGLRAQAQHEPAEGPAVDRRAPDELQAHPRDRPVALLLRRDALPAGDRRRPRLQGPHAHHQRVRQDAGAVPRARGTAPEDQRPLSPGSAGRSA